MELTSNPSVVDKPANFEAIRQYLIIEGALEAILNSTGDSIAVIDVMAAVAWSPNSWNRFKRRIRSDPDFRLGLADAGFIDECQGTGRFVRVAPANNWAAQRLATLEKLYWHLDAHLASTQPGFPEEQVTLA